MGTFVLHSLVCISTALSVKLQSENAGTYVHFVLIYRSPCKIFIYWPIFKIYVLEMATKQGYQNI